MNWNEIVGQENIAKQLQDSIQQKRIGHAQLFLGKYGYGILPLALAYAKEIFKSENEQSASKIEHLNHLDLHFSFPVFKEGNSGLSQPYFDEFRKKVLEEPFFNLDDWGEVLSSNNKQLSIFADEMEAIYQKFSLKSFEGGTKILIMWGADKMNDAASNKFLKFLEEPPKDTIIILLAEDEANILPTILSRTQLVKIPRLEDIDIENYLKKIFPEKDEEIIKEVVFQAQGDLHSALKYIELDGNQNEFEELFVQWVREAFQVKKKPEMLKNIIRWAQQISSWSREKQKKFLNYCAEIFRLALMQNYGMSDLIYKKINISKFNWESFSNFIHGANIENIIDELSIADYHLQRNANAKIVWTDLGIKLSRYIHKKPD